MTEPLGIAWTTLPTREEAEHLAGDAVAAGLAACAQVDGPIRSHYTWEGRVHAEEEYRLTFKFAAAKARDLETWVHARHPYAVPQWLGVQADLASPGYRAWVLGIR
jgi:periplasmic divalent cation tolerance protein